MINSHLLQNLLNNYLNSFFNNPNHFLKISNITFLFFNFKLIIDLKFLLTSFQQKDLYKIYSQFADKFN